ncbi:MAG: sulfur oxidation c-type cytochrome SoxX [Burkholderiales bacterium]|nr:sulfur oxidation c-type cytochrome SoxX [Burkholderiales bacterium]
MKKTTVSLKIFCVISLACVASSGASLAQQTDAALQKTLSASFRAEGQAGMDRLLQDEANRLCSQADASGKTVSDEDAERIRQSSFKAIAWPTDGQFFGDFKLGEKLAQDGRGKTWSDKPGSENGGNCYNCHQISKSEISYGTLGPSLYNYGKLRGVSDVNSVTAKPIIDYTWGKLWNPRAYNACSSMPRFGHNSLLTQAQLKHLMSLLLDPQSPVNQ